MRPECLGRSERPSFTCVSARAARARLVSVSALALLVVACNAASKRRVAAPPVVEAPPLTTLPPRSPENLPRSPSTPVPDAVDVLITRVEEAYSAGLADYRAGNLEKAKEEFDSALALLLQSNLDVREDERLSREFDKLVENIHGVAVAALERGDTLGEQRYEPAPIESFAGLTFPVDPKVKERVRQEVQVVRSDLPLVSNDYVAGVITYFQNRGQKIIRNVLKRSGLYQPIISEALGKEGLPQDLIYLAAAESGFNPFALSRVGAKGIWQLMLGRAIEYGLRKDRWVDEREHPAKSTLAAVRHLKDLYQTFGDWYLAIAAYNCGPVNVQRAIEKTGYADFWTLRALHALPRETENYVPIIVATALIAKDPQAYGFDVQPDPPVASEQLVVSTPTDLRLIAQLIDRPVEELIQLNPGLLRWTTPANDPEYVLNLPPGTRENCEQALALLPPGNRIWWRAHKVQEGETLLSIAKRFRISPASLAQANQIERDFQPEAGTRLVVPLAPGKESSLMRVRERAARRAYRYRVRPGDTLELIADRFDATPYQIRRWNNLKTSRLVAGETIKVYVVASRGRSVRRPRARRHGAAARPSLAQKKATPSKASRAKLRSSSPAKSAVSVPRAAR